MDGRVLTGVVRQLTARYGHPTPGAAPDAELLRLLAEDRCDESFAELHRRHGPLVWAACRSMLNAPADAEDAYQATFLSLVRSADKVRNGAAVGAWLHGVAVRVALKIRQRTSARLAREVRAARTEAERPVADGAWERLLAAVHREVETLPASLRNAFALCDLQGVAQPDAARRLGCTVGSLSSKLAKARTRLAERLRAQGVAPSVASAALGVAATNTEAGTVPSVLATTVREFATTPGVATEVVQTLAKEVMTMTQLKWAVATALAAGVVALGLGAGLMTVAEGQQPASTDNNNRPQRANDASLHVEGNDPPGHYKYVPLAEGLTSEPRSVATKRLDVQKAEGWEFCGSLDMQLTKADVVALQAGGPAPTNEAAGDKLSSYRVLVFKRAAQATAASAPTNTATAGVAPANASTGPIPADVNSTAQVPSTVVYRSKGASTETLEKVATSLAKGTGLGAGGPSATAVADGPTRSLVLTGDAKMIKEIVARLDVLQAELGEAKPATPAEKLNSQVGVRH